MVTWWAVGEYYNVTAKENNWPTVYFDDSNGYTKYYCTVVGFFDQPYGKWPGNADSTLVVMEYEYYLEYFAKGLDPAQPAEFITWLESNPDVLDSFADVIMYTLPNPRWKWYLPSDFQDIQDTITAKTNKIIEEFGFYQLRTCMSLI
jgi:hypothetical protein